MSVSWWFCPTFNCLLLTLVKSGCLGQNLSLHHAVKVFVIRLFPFNILHNVYSVLEYRAVEKRPSISKRSAFSL